jgi:hypothetical protein
MDSLLMSEYERQDRYLASLPKDHTFPLFSGRQAIESQRRSGYKNTACAAREIVDNAIEAGAKNVWVTFDRPNESGRGKNERRNKVSAVAFIDDGPGMSAEMVRYALTWGGGTHFEDPNFIGKFGFGLPNSSINQTRRVEVYSRRDRDKAWHRAVLDITPSNVPPHGLKSIDPAQDADLPKFVKDFLDRNEIRLSCGTVVVWDRPDRLTYREASSLKEHLVDDFGVVYRGLLSRVRLEVEGVEVKPVDPLFLMPGARFVPTADTNDPAYDPDAKRAIDVCAEEGIHNQLAIRYWTDQETGHQHVDLLETTEEFEAAKSDPESKVGIISMRISTLPVGFAKGKGVSSDSVEFKRFEVRKKRRGMSFVRGGREIETVDVFPKSAKEEASGLGDWPLLQTYAYHWAIEVSFGPELDEVFGIGNDKQTVRPVEDFWRALTKAHVDELLQKENNKHRVWREKPKAPKTIESAEANAPAAQAAAAATAVLGRESVGSDTARQAAKAKLDATVKQEQERTGATLEQARKVVEERAKASEFEIKFEEIPGGPFYRADYGAGIQVVVWINKKHPFFEDFYARLSGDNAMMGRNAINLLLIALAQCEVRATDDRVKEIYQLHRESKWSPFLKNALNNLTKIAMPKEEEAFSGAGDAEDGN